MIMPKMRISIAKGLILILWEVIGFLLSKLGVPVVWKDQKYS